MHNIQVHVRTVPPTCLMIALDITKDLKACKIVKVNDVPTVTENSAIARTF